MCPRPRQEISTLQKRLLGRRKSAMTIAIGTYFVGGMIVCADTNVVSADGIVTSGSKVEGYEFPDKTYVIANSGNDANASSMLAKEILASLSKSTIDRWNIEPTIKKTMTKWHSSYTHGKQPEINFILAANTDRQNRRLYYCEPPNTVRPKQFGEPLAIGIGGMIIDPLIPSVITGAVPLRTALLQLAYLMYRAKRDHVYLKGSQTDAFIVRTNGNIYVVSRQDMGEAEAIGPELDHVLQVCLNQLIGGDPDGVNTTGFREFFGECSNKYEALQFSSISDLLSNPSGG